MSRNNKLSPYILITVIVFVLLFYFSSRYLMLWAYQFGYGAQDNKIANLTVEVNKGWYPSLNTSSNNIYTKAVLYFNESDDNNTLIFKKPYITHIGESQNITIEKIGNFDEFYNKANSKNMFNQKEIFSWGEVYLIKSGILNDNQVAAIYKEAEIIIYVDQQSYFNEILSIKY